MLLQNQGLSQYKDAVLVVKIIPWYLDKIIQSHDCFAFIMGFRMPGKMAFLCTKMGPIFTTDIN